jgi:hypothetical protein
MVKYIGNCAEIIPDSYRKVIETNTGEIRPNLKMSQSANKNDYISKQRDEWLNAGYSIDPGSSIEWEMFYQHDFDEILDFSKSPLFKDKKISAWWIPKIRPGKCFPAHRDSFEKSHKNITRWWIALNDHEWGHVFMIEDQLIKNYKKGDIFEFNDHIHGAMNVGTTVKMTLQVLITE